MRTFQAWAVPARVLGEEAALLGRSEIPPVIPPLANLCALSSWKAAACGSESRGKLSRGFTMDSDVPSR